MFIAYSSGSIVPWLFTKMIKEKSFSVGSILVPQKGKTSTRKPPAWKARRLNTKKFRYLLKVFSNMSQGSILLVIFCRSKCRTKYPTLHLPFSEHTLFEHLFHNASMQNFFFRNLVWWNIVRYELILCPMLTTKQSFRATALNSSPNTMGRTIKNMIRNNLMFDVRWTG